MRPVALTACGTLHRTLWPLLTQLVLDGTEKQAKYAARALAALGQGTNDLFGSILKV